jgi:protein gp37/alkylated DNA repair dioxygenase AlkB
MENSNIAWTHNTQNFWLGCDKVAPECAKCCIGRVLQRQGREPWGQLYRTKTWSNPAKWQREAEAKGICLRVFTNSLSDFFHAGADAWRDEAWKIIKDTPNLVWLILTKRPELIASRLPKDWGEGYPNVWLGTSVGCNQTLNKMDALRKIPVHSKAVRFVSCEPLLEDIADQINLDGFGWVIVGGESGSSPEYLWDSTQNWREEFNTPGRRTMKIEWAQRLLEKSRAAGIPYFFKQITSARSGVGEDALGQKYQEFPPSPHGTWAETGEPKGSAVKTDLQPDVLYFSDFLPQVRADELLARIKAQADFRQNRYTFKGNTGLRPRLEAWYGSWDYAYSPGTVLKAAPMPDYLQAVIDRIKACGFGEFNAVLINRYRSGRDYISWHSDDDYGDPEPTIPSITLGEARPFRLRSLSDKRNVVEYVPEHGSLLIMRGTTNAEWEHMVPKTAKEVGERINLTFRFKKGD